MTEVNKPHFLFLVSSGRPNGNTEILARNAAEQLPAEVKQTWLNLNEYPLEMFEDRRHPTVTYSALSENARQLALATLAASDIVMVAPTYWYSLPAPAKLYLDHWTHWLREAELNFKERMHGKNLYLVTVNAEESSAGDEVSQPLLDTMRLTADYLGMRWAGALIGHGNRPGDVLTDTDILNKAKTFLLSTVPAS